MHKKIDIYTRRKSAAKGCSIAWEYACSTTWSKTCKAAKAAFCNAYKLDNTQVKACFAK